VSIPKNELPPLKEGVIFRAITSGGIAGFTMKPIFMMGACLGSVYPNGTHFNLKHIGFPATSAKVSAVVEQQQFEQFNNLSYPAPSGAADYITVTPLAKTLQPATPISIKIVYLAL